MTMNILAVASEAFPLAKTGGLGDAVSGLAHSLGAAGTKITLMLPDYPGTRAHLRQIRKLSLLPGLPGGDAELLLGECPELNLPILLVQNKALYEREGLYMAPDGTDHPDNAIRFAALAHAATRVAGGMDGVTRPHIVHAHDWHTALIPLLMRQCGIDDVKTVLTLHNMAFQGVFPMALAKELGIEERYCSGEGIEFWGQLNFLKAGIRYADLITVVSSNYAREILTPAFGCGLDGVLKDRRRDLISIPNGIDTELWDPEFDCHLKGRAFSVDRLGNKAACKRELQKFFDLEEQPGATLMAMGSRLTTQKMVDVAVQAIPMALDAHPTLQVCVIGQGEKPLERALAGMAQRYPGRWGVHIGFDEAQAHLLHAGADVLLHGSRFEPFGLTPLYSMRYGTIPIGSRVGGMVDTIIDPGAGQPLRAMRNATGILFEGEQPSDMVHAIDRAMALRHMPDIWRAMQQNGMRADFSWANSAPAYVSAYQSLRPDVVLGRIPERQRMPLPLRPVPATSAPPSGGAAGVLATHVRTGMKPGQLTPREASAA